jgi:hypothetical protein
MDAGVSIVRIVRSNSRRQCQKVGLINNAIEYKEK